MTVKVAEGILLIPIPWACNMESRRPAGNAKPQEKERLLWWELTTVGLHARWQLLGGLEVHEEQLKKAISAKGLCQ